MRKQLLDVSYRCWFWYWSQQRLRRRAQEVAAHAALAAANVVHGEDGFSVEFTARGHVTPKVTTLILPRASSSTCPTR